MFNAYTSLFSAKLRFLVSDMFANRVKSLFKIWNEVKVPQLCCRLLSIQRSRGMENWDLVCGVCLERRPIISKPLTPIESSFQKLLCDIEFENSYKCDHELRKEKERKQVELLKKGQLDIDSDVSLIQTAQDLEDSYQTELSSFQFAERIAEGDSKKNYQTLDRALDKYLILVVNQKVGDKYLWVLPQGIREGGETMRQAAERILTEKCGTKLTALFLGNAPCGFYKYRYPTSIRSISPESPVGAKIFFYKAWHHDGHVECNNENVKSYKWLSQEELCEELPNEYYKSVSQFLIT